MYEFFVYDYLERGTSPAPPQRIGVVYSSSAETSDVALMERLRVHFATGIPPDVILLAGTAGNPAMVETSKKLLESPLIAAGLPSMTKYIGPPALNPLWI